jgi:hypothetical protein
MPQFVTKSAYCTGFPCGANTAIFTYTILLYLSNLKYNQYTLLRRHFTSYLRLLSDWLVVLVWPEISTLRTVAGALFFLRPFFLTCHLFKNPQNLQ